MDENKIKSILVLEENYKRNNYNGDKNGDSNFKIIKGINPIILSAPHAVKQIRDGIEKSEDKLTGAIVEYLCKKTKINGIIRTCNYNDDPNYENTGEALKYKEAILNIVKQKNIVILIDIHGCTNKHGFDIELGTNYGENINQNRAYLEIIESELSNIGNVVIDKKFTASSNTTVSNFISKNSGITCIQVEISRKFRKDSLFELLDAFENIINRLVIKIKEESVGSRDNNYEISR